MNEREEYFCKMPMTIERRLKQYAECPGHTERHETLWHEWNHNKRWLTQIQKLILSSFPSYSMHDASHSETVLHNIELILGKKNILELSPTDCFLILQTVYMHDIGMCITHEDRENILKDKKFHDYLKKMKSNTRDDLSKYAEILLAKCNDKGNLSDISIEALLKKKLDIYYAIIYLLADYRRREHGDISTERLISWINHPDKLGSGFSTIEIPERLYYIIAYCANTHTKWDFNEVLKLHQEDTGYVLDYVHPRFIAVLLQLGDALDMDNNRFHPLIHEYMGEIPENSEAHYKKHKSIRRLRITNEKISISANCDSQRELRLVRQECDMISSILQKVSYYWSVIRPKEMNIGLPTLDKTVLLLKGVEIPENLVQAQFEISQNKAFELLEGNGFYLNEKFAFLRELFQNAVDATKIQYFRDCKRRMKISEKEDPLQFSPHNLSKILPPTQYPIQIELIITGYDNGKQIPLPEDGKCTDDTKYGVLVRIRDYGTGISQNDIIKIANVGSSYECRKAEIEKMPKWLQPTGLFGIGLQSVFLSAEVLSAKTLTRNGEGYEIHFYPRAKNVNGYINVTPYQDINEYEPFGTCFEVFIPNSKKLLHKQSPESWDGRDPFEENYKETSVVRHARELVKQFSYYLAEMIGEPLFPVSLCIRDKCNGEVGNIYDGNFRSHFNHTLTVLINDERNQEDSFVPQTVSWAYKRNMGQNDCYELDPKTGKLYIWNKKYNAYACLGIDRIWESKKQMSSLNFATSPLDINMKIFYKGIKVTETMSLRQDANLIEFIDLKDTLNSDYLKLNRNGFSEEGLAYLDEIYEGVLLTAKQVLREIANKEKPFEELKVNLENLLNKDTESFEEVQKYILSITALAYFAMVNDSENGDSWMQNTELEQRTWNELILWIIKLDKSDKPQVVESFNKVMKSTSLFNMVYYKYAESGISRADDKVSVLNVIDKNRKYAIISRREGDSKYWDEWIIEIKNSCFESICSKIKLLENISSLSDGIRIMKEIDRNCEKLGAKVEISFETSYEDRKQMPILRWFLQNIPTIALWTSEDDRTRVNIMNLETDGSIYMSGKMRLLALERMTKVGEKTKIQRFSTHVWSGYKELGLKKKRQSILFVTRGKFSNLVCREMIVPFTYDQMNDLAKILKYAVEKQFSNLKEKFLLFEQLFWNPIIAHLNEVSEPQGIVNNFWHIIKQEFEKKQPIPEDKEKNSDSQIINAEALTDDDYKYLITALEDRTNIEDSNIYRRILNMLRELKNEWSDISKYEKEYMDVYQKFKQKNTNYKNMISYISNNSERKPSKERTEQLYHRYIFESCFLLLEQQKKEYLEKWAKEKAEISGENSYNLYTDLNEFLSTENGKFIAHD